MRKILTIVAVCGAFFVAAPAWAATGTISGTVTHASNGTPIASAFIYAQNVSTHSYVYAVSGADGTYTATLVPPGTYDVWTVGSLTDSNVAYIKKVISVTVGDGADVTGQNLSITQRGEFVGHVYAADGVTPLSSAAMTFTSASGSINGYDSGVTTASNGSYTSTPNPTDLTVSATGLYTVTIFRAGYFTLSVSNINLTADETNVTQDFRMTTASTVSGTIRDANGAAVSGAVVTLSKTSASSSSGSYSASTNAAGAYTVNVYDQYPVNGTAIADYNVSISKTGYVTKTSTLSITAESSTLTGKDYALITGKTFSGTVVAKSSNSPLTAAVVNLYSRNQPRSSNPDFTFTTTGDGTFSFSSLPSGKYRLRITRSGYVTIVIDSININKNITGQTYKLDAAGTLAGLIYTGKSVGLNGISIGVFSLKNGKTAAYTSATTDDTGHYSISSLKAGAYRLKISSTDYVTQLVNVTVKAGKTVTKNVKLAAAGSIEGYLTDKETGLPVSYLVDNVFGFPTTSVLVRVVGTSIYTLADQNGYYVLDGIAPGTRAVTVVSYLYDAPKQIKVKVSAGKTTTGVNFSLKPKQ